VSRLKEIKNVAILILGYRLNSKIIALLKNSKTYHGWFLHLGVGEYREDQTDTPTS
jgi:hypothetical protein